MKYTPSPLLSELSGAAGSVVGSHNRFGPYLRTRTIPVNPMTAAQILVRNTLKAASQNWRVLTEAQRQAWEAAALLIPRVDALGRTYYQTGAQFYVSTQLAIKQYDITAAFSTIPSSVVTPIDLASVTLSPNAGASTFGVAFTATPLAALTKLVIFASPQVSPGISFIKPSLMRLVTVSAAAAASPIAFGAAYSALMGALVAGKKIRVITKAISSSGGRSNTNDQIAVVA